MLLCISNDDLFLYDKRIFYEYFYRYEWIDDSAFFDVLKDGFQTLRIPKSGTYKFELIAPGWNTDCSGARVCGSVILKQGTGQMRQKFKYFLIINYITT